MTAETEGLPTQDQLFQEAAMRKDRVIPLDPHNLEVARVLARELICFFGTLEIVRRALRVS